MLVSKHMESLLVEMGSSVLTWFSGTIRGLIIDVFKMPIRNSSRDIKQ